MGARTPERSAKLATRIVRYSRTEQSLRDPLFLNCNQRLMHHSSLRSWKRDVGRREFPRIEIDCRARIRIGNRQYAAYLYNISRKAGPSSGLSPPFIASAGSF